MTPQAEPTMSVQQDVVETEIQSIETIMSISETCEKGDTQSFTRSQTWCRSLAYLPKGMDTTKMVVVPSTNVVPKSQT